MDVDLASIQVIHNAIVPLVKMILNLFYKANGASSKIIPKSNLSNLYVFQSVFALSGSA